MLIRQKPEDAYEYIQVSTDEANLELQKAGFTPLYYYDNIFYYKRDFDIIEYIIYHYIGI